ncbi:hypothetical protein F4677DRAFT_449797 [Hypoxylon crocopeplum]|nr:hypothetical protein F4677DRAFT_449797 [Hypoxylon crocopeplum]
MIDAWKAIFEAAATQSTLEDKDRALLEQFKSHDDSRTRTSLQQAQIEDIYEPNEDEFLNL